MIALSCAPDSVLCSIDEITALSLLSANPEIPQSSAKSVGRAEQSVTDNNRVTEPMEKSRGLLKGENHIGEQRRRGYHCND
ncbi:hypothetical protein H206_05136 [Candidatus Electrothrix aarhusensis]|uniref:Uncharacterized protein n=1 Tax=Candidatus Electrothrix aarhusensis TaxID=1859131 RepID=A0A444J5G3_9BACT|nr:hypothetical protein H206_05136 [Candidatus Electrothrix aarhusensis]